MFKKLQGIGFIFSIILISCNTEHKDEETKDKILIEYPKEIKSFISIFEEQKPDFKIDKLFLEDTLKNNKKHLLSLEQVKSLAKNLSKDEHTEVNAYYVKDYYKIQQKKMDSDYDEFVKTLDIGMMKDVNCYAAGKINFGDTVSVLFWKIVFSSYEACPFYQGTNVLATVISDKQVVQTIQVSCNETAADAPFSATTLQKMKLDDKGNLVTSSESVTMEEDTETEHITDTIEYKLTKKGFVKK